MAPPSKNGMLTAIEPQARTKNRVSVFIDGEFAFGLDADVAEQFGLRVGQHVDDRRLEKILFEEEYKRACQRAFRFLAARPRSQKEIEDRLARYDYPAETIARVIAKCKSLAYIDDRQFAFQFARSLLARKQIGAELMRTELFKRGISDDLTKEVIAEVYREHDEFALAKMLAEKRATRLRELPNHKARARLAAFLKRRGFAWETIREVVDACLGEVDF